MKTYLRLLSITIIMFMLSACSTIDKNAKLYTSKRIQDITFKSPIEQQRVIIYNHGINRPQKIEPCFMFYNKPPRSLFKLADDKTLIYQLCSTATESHLITHAGRQVYLRKKEIDFAIDAFLARGISPKNLFLAGHSNGGWTSLMMMRDVNKRFNGVIAYAPAFAGKREEQAIAPWWRTIVRPRQIKDMLGATRMDALVFAYYDDGYNRPQDLQFLAERYPFNGHSGVDFVSYGCGLREGHHTFRKDCRRKETTQRIKAFIDGQIANW